MISNIVIFIGGPKHLALEEIHHPQSYLQVPENSQGKMDILSSKMQPMYKVATYRLERYQLGPGIIIPFYVIQGMSHEEAAKILAEYFLNLMIQDYSVNGYKFSQKTAPDYPNFMNPTPEQIYFYTGKQNGKSLEQEIWYQNLLKDVYSPGSLTGLKQGYLDAIKKIKEQGIISESISPPSAGKQVTGTSVLGQLIKLFPQLTTTSGICPSKDCGAKGRISDLIQHLNDVHKWQIATAIADWLESLDIKFEVKA